MKKYIAVTLAGIVIVGTLLFSGTFTPSTSRPLTLDLPTLSVSLPGLTGLGSITSNPGAEAWETFLAYRKANEAHDLARVKELSYQLSPECSDPARLQECFQLMDSAVFFTEGFKQSDFKNIAFDEWQVVLSTDYAVYGEGGKPLKIVLYFVRIGGDPKILGLRFCIGNEGEDDECVNTDPATRDRNQNNWWDDVEVLFK